MDYLTHLSIQKCISNYHLFLLDLFLEALAFEGKIVEIEREGSQTSVTQPLLELLQLLNESSPYF